LQEKPHAPFLHVAVAFFGGAAQGVQELPQLAVLVFETQAFVQR
jgi:hypothetical protein